MPWPRTPYQYLVWGALTNVNESFDEYPWGCLWATVTGVNTQQLKQCPQCSCLRSLDWRYCPPQRGHERAVTLLWSCKCKMRTGVVGLPLLKDFLKLLVPFGTDPEVIGCMVAEIPWWQFDTRDKMVAFMDKHAPTAPA